VRTMQTLMLLLTLGLAIPLCGADQQATSTIINKTYRGQRMLLRTFYADAKVQYGADGRVIDGGTPGPLTLDAYIQPKDFKLKGSQLVIRGNRLYFIYDKKLGKLTPRRGPKVEVDIATGNGAANVSALQDEIAKVFIMGRESLVNFVPSFWKDFLLHPDKQTHEKPCGALFSAGGKSVPPTPLYKPEPAEPIDALAAHVQGTVVLSIIIGENGRVQRARIVRPLGMGVDDSAIRTVETWKFKPASRDGRPIAFPLCANLSFGLN
jgi:TonB family protein